MTLLLQINKFFKLKFTPDEIQKVFPESGIQTEAVLAKFDTLKKLGFKLSDLNKDKKGNKDKVAYKDKQGKDVNGLNILNADMLSEIFTGIQSLKIRKNYNLAFKYLEDNLGTIAKFKYFDEKTNTCDLARLSRLKEEVNQYITTTCKAEKQKTSAKRPLPTEELGYPLRKQQAREPDTGLTEAQYRNIADDALLLLNNNLGM